MPNWKNMVVPPGSCHPARFVSTGRYAWMIIVITRREYNMSLSGVEFKLFCPVNDGIFDYPKVYIAENPIQPEDYCFSQNIKFDILEGDCKYSIEEFFQPKIKKKVIHFSEPLDNEQDSWLKSFFKLILGISDRSKTIKYKVISEVNSEKKDTDEWSGRFAAPISIELLEQRIQFLETTFRSDYSRRIKNMPKSIDDKINSK